MARKSRALTGAAKNAYLKRVIRSEAGMPTDVGERLAGRLIGDIASLGLRDAASEAFTEAILDASREAVASTLPPPPQGADSPSRQQTGDGETSEAKQVVTPSDREFDPFSPNVIVVIRTRGREAVLSQLGRIEAIDDLRLLAREQQLGISQDLVDADEIRNAIVAAAERRIANRRAAAS